MITRLLHPSADLIHHFSILMFILQELFAYQSLTKKKIGGLQLL